jgi:hypothetical protein
MWLYTKSSLEKVNIFLIHVAAQSFETGVLLPAIFVILTE